VSLPSLSPARYRFSVFEAHPQTCELRKNGIRLRIQDQPFQVLLRLLERPGQIVTREELKTALWSADTFVDFDNGLNMAVKRLREVLGDDAERPNFIETLPRRGYRFIGPVENGSAIVEVSTSSPATKALPRTTKKWVVLISLLCLFVVAGIPVWLKLGISRPIPRVVDSAPITKDGIPKSQATFKLVRDGARLYFQEGLLNQIEQNTALVQVATHGGETARIPTPLRNPVVYDFSQTRSELLLSAGDFPRADSDASGDQRDLPSDERPLWALPLPAGPPHRLGDIAAHDASWAPDGSHLAFANGKDVFLANADGSQVRKLATANGFDVSFWIRFSPDGKRLRFSVARFRRPEDEMEYDEIMEMAADGTGLHLLPIHGGCCGTWSPDGNYYFYEKGRDTWALPERHLLFGKVRLDDAVQLTSGPIPYDPPTPGASGKELFMIGHQNRVELVHYSAEKKQWEPFLGGISAGELQVSPDGQWVVYSTFPESNLWRSKLDGSERLQLTFAPISAHEPRWSPDGKQILFTDFPFALLVISANGGAPRQLMPRDHPDSIGAAAWLPDGNSIVFGRHMGCPGGDISCWGIFRLDLKTQQVSKIPESDEMVGARLSPDGRYVAALPVGRNKNKVMLYDFQTRRWTELANAFGTVAWSHDSRSIYMHLKHQKEPADLIRVSVPDGRVQRVLDLNGMTLGGFWHDWVSLLPDDSPLLMLDRSTEEIYRLDLQYH
jgi:Tol biopolymer transport system component/DNA-binding winged helix-turn-helix (wHTH) protein